MPPRRACQHPWAGAGRAWAGCHADPVAGLASGRVSGVIVTTSLRAFSGLRVPLH